MMGEDDAMGMWYWFELLEEEEGEKENRGGEGRKCSQKDCQ